MHKKLQTCGKNNLQTRDYNYTCKSLLARLSRLARRKGMGQYRSVPGNAFGRQSLDNGKLAVNRSTIICYSETIPLAFVQATVTLADYLRLRRLLSPVH